MVRAIMHGCNGKMGRAITTLAKEDAEVEIVAGVDAYTEVANEYPVFDSIEKCDVLISQTQQQLMSFWMYVWRKLFRLFFAQQDFQRNSFRR